MKEVDPTDLLRLLLSMGLTVCYIDADDRRRERARRIAIQQMAKRDHFCDLFGLPLCAALQHYDVTIAVNPPSPNRVAVEDRWADWIMISATNITVDTPEKPKGPAASPQSPPDIF